MLFANRDSDAVQSNTFKFDFGDLPAGDGEANIVDVQALFVENTRTQPRRFIAKALLD